MPTLTVTLNEEQIRRVREQVMADLHKDLISALEITQRSYEGSFEGGYTIRVTGHEMRYIQDVLDRVQTE